MVYFFNVDNPFMPAHNTCEFWDQNNSSNMDHITNPVPPHSLRHDPHYCLDYDFLVAIKLPKEHHFVLLNTITLFQLASEI